MTYKQHPLSAAFPPMSADDFLTLKDSVEDIGVQNPITIYEGMVLDGWHRYSASVELGMACPEVELGAVDPVAFVRAQNKERRHLSAGAWALIEVQLWDWKPSHRPPIEKGEPSSPFSAPLESPARPERSNADMAKAVGVTGRTIQHAKQVEQNAAPEIKAEVKKGAISLKTAVALSDLPQGEQTALAAKGPDALRQAARDKAPRALAPRTESAPEIEELRARIEELEDIKAAYEGRNAELEEENARLQLSVDPDVLARISELRTYTQTVEQTRDHLMNENAQLKQQLKRAQRAADKKGAA
ncbi:hypothetical protein [Schauerella aestuarii]|uniref:hypothetical protein n=1 Tax=Schauerella aestuarii TaxID=2511204 RepID=UPI00136A661C|nr:hypothetical protein [Achromobacter aestuarii]MYZ44192.1 hypothetical protein [Achromobacter aestuarii]